MSYCSIHGLSHKDDAPCPVRTDVEAAVEHAIRKEGWRGRFLRPESIAEAARLAFSAALAEDTAEHRRRAQRDAEAEVEHRYEDEAYRHSQAERRANREIAAAKYQAERDVETARTDMRDVLTGFVQALVDHHLPHEAVEQAANRVAEEGWSNYIGRDAFALDMADEMVGEPAEPGR